MLISDDKVRLLIILLGEPSVCYIITQVRPGCAVVAFIRAEIL